MTRGFKRAVIGMAALGAVAAAVPGAAATSDGSETPTSVAPVTAPPGDPEAPATGEPPAAEPALAWHDCADGFLAAAQLQCAEVEVPLDAAAPDGDKVSVAISRRAATAPADRRQGPLLVNFGGPGGRGIDAPLFFGAALPADLVAQYDLIGFDPRGLGDSTPNIRCNPSPLTFKFPDYGPLTGPDEAPGHNEHAWLARWDTITSACVDHTGAALAHHRSIDVVRDMDAIRAALGADELNFYGFSYGTLLGQLYAATYPDKARRVVLDGNLDKSTWGLDDLPVTASGAERVTDEFFAWMAAHDDVYGLGTDGGDVRAAFLRGQDLLREAPTEWAGAPELYDMLYGSMYNQQAWPYAAEILVAVANGDTSLLNDFWAPFPVFPEEQAAIDAAIDNSQAVFLAALCGDNRYPADYATWRQVTEAAAQDAPINAWPQMFGFYLGCLSWPYQQDPVAADGTLAPPLLLTTTAQDPATPIANSLSVRAQFPNASLVVDTDSRGHTATLMGNPCVDGAVFAYLRTGELPPRVDGADHDLACDGHAQPDPFPLLPPASDGAAQRVQALREMLGLAGPSALAATTGKITSGDPEARRQAAVSALHARIIAGVLALHHRRQEG